MVKTIAKDHALKKEAILSCAVEVFATIGFDRASMNQVAKACGVSKPALYHYFSGKNEILYSILHHHLQGLRDHMLSLEKGERDHEQFLYYAVEEILLFYRGNDNIHALQLHALGQLDQDEQKVLKEHMRELVHYVSELIRAIHPEIFKNNDDNLRMATMSLFGMLNWYYTWNHRRNSADRKAYARYATDILLHGLAGYANKDKGV